MNVLRSDDDSSLWMTKVLRAFQCCLPRAPSTSFPKTSSRTSFTSRSQTFPTSNSTHCYRKEEVRCPGYDFFWIENGVAVHIYLQDVRREDICLRKSGRHIEIRALQSVDSPGFLEEERRAQSFIERSGGKLIVQKSFHSSTAPDFSRAETNVPYPVVFKIRFRIDPMFDVLLARILSFHDDVLILTVPLFEKKVT